MSRCRYPIRLKVEAIRRVVGEGRSVVDVARDLGVGQGSVFFWVRRYREHTSRQRAALRVIGGRSGQASVEQAVDGAAETLTAYLRTRKK